MPSPNSGIFLRTSGGLVVLEQTPYDSEAVLQTALAEFPEVIAGSTTGGESEQRLLLITREMSVPSSDASGRTFSLDHLFVDSDCVPIFVEVKRASDTRIRREVVGQMLDYAANGVKYWPVEDLQRSLATRAAEAGSAVDELIATLDPELDVDDFWKQVEGNLRSGRVRLLFVADHLPAELVRIIEFLNEQMTPAEVLGVELQQFSKRGHVAYVPVVKGQTAAAVTAKGASPTQVWARDSFMEAVLERCSTAEVALIQQLLDHLDRHGGRPNWGKGVTPGMSGWYPVGGRQTGLWSVNANSLSTSTKAYMVFYFADLVTRIGPERLERAASKLEGIPSMAAKLREARASGWRKYPSVYLPDVAGDDGMERCIFDALAALIDQ